MGELARLDGERARAGEKARADTRLSGCKLADRRKQAGVSILYMLAYYFETNSLVDFNFHNSDLLKINFLNFFLLIYFLHSDKKLFEN